MLVSKQPKQQTHPIESSYVSGKIECNSEEAISLYVHIYDSTRGGLPNTPGWLLWTMQIVTVPVQIQNIADGQINYSSYLDY